MGFFEFFSDIASTLSISSVDADSPRAEAPHTGDEHNSAKNAGTSSTTATAEQRSGSGVRGGASSATDAAEGDEEGKANKEDVKSKEPEAGHKPSAGAQQAAASSNEDEEEDAEEEEEEEEEEEDDDEPKDLKPKFEEECTRSAECAPHKHHYDHCVERVTKQIEESDDGKASEDCVEEFFHLAHCATACAAPKLFRSLK